MKPRSRGPLRCAIAAALFASSTLAWAGGEDTVFLANGGRLRGVVVEDDVKAGVTIKLADGTIRKLPRAQIARVDYAEAEEKPAAPPPSPPVEAATAPAPAPIRPLDAPLPTDAASGHATAFERRSPTLMVLGIVMMPVGAVTLSVGAVFFAIGNGTQRVGTAYCGGGYDCSTQYNQTEVQNNEGLAFAGVGMMIGGGVVATTGLAFTLVGAAKVPPEATEANAGVSLGVGPTSARLSGRF